MLMNKCYFFCWFLSDIGDSDNNTTFVGSYCLFVALVVKFAPHTARAMQMLLRRTQINNMPCKSHVIALFTKI